MIMENGIFNVGQSDDTLYFVDDEVLGVNHVDPETILEHEGVKRKSGRYEWGSGEVPYQHEPWFKKGVVPVDKKGFYNRYRTLKTYGMSDKEIAEDINKELFNGEKDYRGNDKFNTTKLRQWVTIGKEQQNAENVSTAIRLRNERQMSLQAIADKMGTNESTIRSWLEPGRLERMNSTRAVANTLVEAVDNKKYLDIGKSTELQLNISKEKLDAAVEMLSFEGYKVSMLKAKQVGRGGQFTWTPVLTKDDVSFREINEHLGDIKPLTEFYSNDGKKILKKEPPRSVDSKRIEIIYAEDGGAAKDGVIELRPNVPDISLGADQYAQVRIAVDGTHYLKGMAVYNDNLPKGIDIRFNTNKHKDVPALGNDPDNTVLKKFKKNEDGSFKDPDLPFGANTKENEHYEENGKEVQSCINKVNTDEDWEKWSRNLPSQFLSKQDPKTAKQQLGIAYDLKENEFEKLMALENPTVKKKLLADFADECDSDATHLKAAPFPGQSTHVLLPCTSLKKGEIYAPNFKQGEEVILVRFPHESISQIPRLKVNNRNKEAKTYFENAAHAVGVNSETAAQMSGADFDGDTVMVIPVRGQKLRSRDPFEKLKGYDPSESYPAYKGMKRVGEGDGFKKGLEMGKISNLITDMTVAGAPEEEVVRAIKHSMCVIDAEKHNLNWRGSYEDNRIAELKEKYQGGKNKGASTIISQSTSPNNIHRRKEIQDTSKMTPSELKRWKEGEHIYRDTEEKYLKPTFSYTDKDGHKKTTSDVKYMTAEQKQQYYEDRKQYDKDRKEYLRELAKDPNAKPKYTVPKRDNGVKYHEEYMTQEVSKMSTTKDANELISGNNAVIEHVYADHANRLKALALKARAESRATPNLVRDPVAAKEYDVEVKSLKAKLNAAQLNAARERQANRIAEQTVKAKKQAAKENGEVLTKDQTKKIETKALNDARKLVAPEKKVVIEITPREWDAIQKGAVSNSMLVQLMEKAKPEQIRQYATPKKERAINKNQLARAKRLIKAGNTQAEVAEMLGISPTTLTKYINNM